MTESVKAATMDEFKQTPYYQGLGIDALEERLAGLEQDEEQLRSQAEAQYRPTYESEREAAQQAFEKEMQGYNAQLSGTGAAYDRQRRNAEQAYEESAAAMNNQLTKRGLGRSSLVAAQGAYLQNQRNQALAEIDRSEGDAINAINERIALLTEQAAQNERTMAGNYARQLQDRVNELREKNQSASISLQLQIAALQQQGYEAYQDWLLANRKQEIAEKEFEAEYGTGKGSSSSGGGTKKPSSSAGTNQGTEKSTGKISEKASAAAKVLADGLKWLIGGLSSAVNSADSAQEQTAGAKGTGGGRKFTQNAKE